MYLHQLSISGFKNFGDQFSIEFNDGLNVLVGENGVGKSAIIDAIRHLLLEDEFGRSGIADADFNHPFGDNTKKSECIRLSATFSKLTKDEKVAFLPWTELKDQAYLNFQVDNKPNNKGRYRRLMWGGFSRNSIFEWELLDRIDCIYLPPLRDAESKLREGRGSRLAKLLRNLNKREIDLALEKGEPHPIEKDVNLFNSTLSKPGTVIANANNLIRSRLKDAIGEVFSQDTAIQFSEMSFNNIVENLRLLFFPKNGMVDNTALYRRLEQNSLGYNNLLYLATVLAEFTNQSDSNEFLKVLLIEEPEAHLHPQLQTRLLKYLETNAKKEGTQIIVTTHSPILSSAISIDSIIHISNDNGSQTAVPVSSCSLSSGTKKFLNRWLDVTKSVLFFARGIILVEGIAEAMVLPELARIVIKDRNGNEKNQKLPENLDEAGITVINMGGIYFYHFMQLFSNINDDTSNTLPIRCVGITDNDPPKNTKPTKKELAQGGNPALSLVEKVNNSLYCRLFSCTLKTFEYDLAMEGGNLNMMIQVYLELLKTDGQIRNEFEKYQQTNWQNEDDEKKKEVAYKLLEKIDEKKGEFSQLLSEKLNNDKTDFAVPEYIKKAVIWVLTGDELT